jgi:hypothetical protein
MLQNGETLVAPQLDLRTRFIQDAQLDGSLGKILKHLNANRASLESHELLCDEVETFLQLLKSRGLLSQTEEREYFEALMEHRRTTLGNVQAYKPETRFQLAIRILP